MAFCAVSAQDAAAWSRGDAQSVREAKSAAAAARQELLAALRIPAVKAKVKPLPARVRKALSIPASVLRRFKGPKYSSLSKHPRHSATA